MVAPVVESLTQSLRHPVVQRLGEQLAARTAHEHAYDPAVRQAAVAAVLRVTCEPELLFIKRADVEGDPWSGHMAFPGGRHDATDASLVETVVRETREETAIDLVHGGQLLGVLDDLSPRSPSLPPIMIRPYVAVVSADAVISANDEVAAYFWVSLAQLRDPALRAEHELLVGGLRQRFPGYRVGPHIAWGLTERIVFQLLGLLDD